MKEDTNKLLLKFDNNSPVIDILLSTYNGEQFIKEQIDSLLNQTYLNWRLIVRDDGSLDNTISIIKSYVDRYPEKMRIITDNDKHLGACQSFSRILSLSTADYIMCCDQDDIWLFDKIRITLDKMIEVENYEKKRPVLIHTDLKVVDEKINIISNSFWEYQRINPKRNRINHLLIQNSVTGCAMMINRALKERAIPIPSEAIMHDWWFALMASTFGLIRSVDTPTILYRQHNSNDTGAKKYSIFYYLQRIRKLNDSILSNQNIVNQGKTFLERFRSQLDPSQYKTVHSFSNILSIGRGRRLIYLFKYKLWKYGKVRNIGYSLVLMIAKQKK